MGHALTNDTYAPEDTANPDMLRRITEKMNLRPSILILNAMMRRAIETGAQLYKDGALDLEVAKSILSEIILSEKEEFMFSNGTEFFVSNRSAVIQFQEDTDYTATFMANDLNDIAKIIPHGHEVSVHSHFVPVSRPRTEISMAGSMYQLANAALRELLLKPEPLWIADMERTKEAIWEPMVVNDEEDHPVDPIPVGCMAKPEEKESEVVAESVAHSGTKTNPTWDMTPKDRGAVSGVGLYLTSTAGELLALPDTLQIKTRGRRGERLFGEHARICSGFEYASELPAIIIAEDGTAYRLREGACLDSIVRNLGGNKPICCLQHPAIEGVKLLCLASDGKVGVIHGSALPDRDTEVFRLIQPGDGSKLVCVTTVCDDDILLVTSDGQGLRVDITEFETQSKCGGRKMVRGIAVGEGAEPVAAIPFREGTNLLAVADDGHILKIGSAQKSALMRHGRGGKGICLMKLEEGARLTGALDDADALILCASDGAVRAINASEITPIARANRGIIGTKCNRQQKLVAAFGGELLLPEDS